MTALTVKDIAKKMKDIDFTMLSTRTDGDAIGSRPMSNNGDVEYDGDSWFFAFEDARSISDIESSPKVGLSLHGSKGLLGQPGIFIAIEGTAELVRDKSAFEAHWNKDIERWAKDGINTPGLLMIKVRADRIHYWDGEDEGEIQL